MRKTKTYTNKNTNTYAHKHKYTNTKTYATDKDNKWILASAHLYQVTNPKTKTTTVTMKSQMVYLVNFKPFSLNFDRLQGFSVKIAD